MRNRNAIAALVFLVVAWAASGCSSKAVYGGMIGAGIGGLQGETISGMMIGAGVGGMIDAMEEDEEKAK
jgi:Glycine zipper